LQAIKSEIMTEQTNKSKGMYWLMFLVSISIMAFLLMTTPEWFWLALPTTVTGFALGMDWI
jgi:hypothetical protein